MQSRIWFALLLGANGCAQIVDSDAPYVLVEGSSSSSGTGGTGSTGDMGGMGGSGGGFSCATDTNCPATGVVCSVAVCMDGSCETRSESIGTPCNEGSPGVCDGQGACVECTLPENCVGIIEDQCTKRACVNHICEVKYLGPESPASPTFQQPGDCKAVVCDGLGGTKSINDDTDTPNDDNGCTTDSCLNGTKVFTAVAMGTNCGVNSYCNSTGQCQGCLEGAHCAGSYDFCKQPTCNSGVCGVSYTADGIPLPSFDQTAKDCQVRECDGNGNIVARVDTTDVSVDDNACTRDECGADGTPFNPPEPENTACGAAGEVCDGNGTCRQPHGTPCSTGSECVSTYCVDGVCCENACNGTCLACNVSSMTAGMCTVVPFGQQDEYSSAPCTDASTCDGNGTCKKNDGETCALASDCLSDFCVDGRCCVSACTTQCKACNVAGLVGTCANIPKGSTDDAAMLLCNGTKACDGNGACKLANGQPCTTDGECVSGNCKNGQNKCQP